MAADPVVHPPAGDLPPGLAANQQYEIQRELGRGGMGVVYLAKNKLMDRFEVLKVVNKTLLDHSGAVERFLREIRSAAKLSHPNVVAAYSAVQQGELLAFAMEYVQGQDLASLVKSRGPLPVLHACYYVQQAALGLQHAHEEQMVHRDIKPQNLMLTHKGKKHVVKVLDFGLAKVMSEKKSEAAGLTGEGRMLGTPDYIAPEQTMDAANADIRADIYSLGCTLYFLLSGRPPFSGSSLGAILVAHQMHEAKPLNLVRPEVPEELAAVVRKMMAKAPAKRYQTPRDVALVLAPFVKPGASPKPPELSSGTSKSQSVPKKLVPIARPPEPAAAEGKHPPEPVSVWETLTEGSTASTGTRESAGGQIRDAATVEQRSVRQKWLLGGGIGSGALLLALLGMWAGGVFKVKVKEGTIVLENLSPGAEVLVDGEKVAVTWGGDGKKAEIRVKPGTRKIVARKDGITVVGEEVEIADGGRKVLSAKLEPAPIAPAKTALDSWFTVGTKWEGKAAFTMGGEASRCWWFRVFSREENKFKGRLVSDGRGDLTIEGTLAEDGKSFRWTSARHTPNVWWPQPAFESLTGEGKCTPERSRVDWKATQASGAVVEGNCEFTIRKIGPRKDDEEIWPPPLHPRRAIAAPAGRWSIQDEELVQDAFVRDVNNNPVLFFGDLGWRDYDFRVKAMKTGGENGFIIIFDAVRPGRKITQWCIGLVGNRQTYVEIVEGLPTGIKLSPLSGRKPRAIVNNRWYDILIKTRGEWIECFLDGESVFRISHPDRWGGKVGFTCLRMTGRFKDIEVTAPDGKVLWKGPPELP